MEIAEKRVLRRKAPMLAENLTFNYPLAYTAVKQGLLQDAEVASIQLHISNTARITSFLQKLENLPGPRVAFEKLCYLLENRGYSWLCDEFWAELICEKGSLNIEPRILAEAKTLVRERLGQKHTLEEKDIDELTLLIASRYQVAKETLRRQASRSGQRRSLQRLGFEHEIEELCDKIDECMTLSSKVSTLDDQMEAGKRRGQVNRDSWMMETKDGSSGYSTMLEENSVDLREGMSSGEMRRPQERIMSAKSTSSQLAASLKSEISSIANSFIHQNITKARSRPGEGCLQQDFAGSFVNQINRNDNKPKNKTVAVSLKQLRRSSEKKSSERKKTTEYEENDNACLKYRRMPSADKLGRMRRKEGEDGQQSNKSKTRRKGTNKEDSSETFNDSINGRKKKRLKDKQGSKEPGSSFPRSLSTEAGQENVPHPPSKKTHRPGSSTKKQRKFKHKRWSTESDDEYEVEPFSDIEFDTTDKDHESTQESVHQEVTQLHRHKQSLLNNRRCFSGREPPQKMSKVEELFWKKRSKAMNRCKSVGYYYFLSEHKRKRCNACVTDPDPAPDSNPPCAWENNQHISKKPKPKLPTNLYDDKGWIDSSAEVNLMNKTFDDSECPGAISVPGQPKKRCLACAYANKEEANVYTAVVAPDGERHFEFPTLHKKQVSFVDDNALIVAKPKHLDTLRLLCADVK